MALPNRIAADPWRVMFPLGLLLSWAGVSHWVLVRAGFASATSAFHAIAQIEGFIWCFVVGFLFTMVPRRTQSAAPGVVDLSIGVAVPVLATGFARLEAFAISQTIWLVGAAALVRFVLLRFHRGARRPPVAFIWIPMAILIGVSGAITTAIGAALPEFAAWHTIGKLMLTQGMVFGFVLGAGSIVVPLLTRGEAPPDAGSDAARGLLGHALAAVVLVASFVVEVLVSQPLGLAIRAALALALVLLVLRLHRRPTLPGWNRWAIWIAAWCIPLGYALMTLWSVRPQLGLHVVFVGGFAPLALGVGLHVTLSHAGQRDRAGSWGFGAALPVALLAIALVCRVTAELDLVRWTSWLAAAGSAFLLATLAWLIRAWSALRVRS